MNPQNYAYISIKKTNLQYCKGESIIFKFYRLTWIAANCPEFISKDEWPPNSPDLNPLDYHVWGAMLHLYQKYQPRPTNISELKVALQSIWNDLPQDPIDRSILSFTKRLRACIKANGGILNTECD